MKTINNNTEEDYVDFDNAKLLKEKGFDNLCHRTRSEANKELSPFPLLKNMGEEIIEDCLDYQWRNSNIHKDTYATPTIQLARKWIYENYGIWINVSSSMQVESDFRKVKKGTFSFGYTISWGNEEKFTANYNKSIISKDGFKSPEEAYQAGIKYCLTKLIK